MILLPQGPREDEDLHARRGTTTTSRLHRLEGAATHEHRIELAVDGVEVDLRVDDDPIGFPVPTGDESVQAHRHPVANTPERLPRLLVLALSGFPRHVTSSNGLLLRT